MRSIVIALFAGAAASLVVLWVSDWLRHHEHGHMAVGSVRVEPGTTITMTIGVGGWGECHNDENGERVCSGGTNLDAGGVKP